LLAILQELTYDSLLEGAVWPFDDHYIRPPHFHGQLECLVIRRGTARLHLGSSSETVRMGQLCWILPGVPHVMIDFSPDFDMWVVQLDPALVGSSWRAGGSAMTAAGGQERGRDSGSAPRRDIVRETVRAPAAPLFDVWPVVLGERLAGRASVEVGVVEIERLSALAARVWSASSPAEARPHLRALCERALRVTWPNVDERREASMSQLASCLLLASPMMDRPSLAAELGISEGFLSRRFHRELGVTFIEHRARTRVAHFLALAQGGGNNLLGAALEAGFGSYSQFHRTFTRVSGSGPRDYLHGGRHRLQLLVASRAQPQSATRSLPDRLRQRAPADA
jgi:AraC-like DNA-binding protein